MKWLWSDKDKTLEFDDNVVMDAFLKKTNSFIWMF